MSSILDRISWMDIVDIRVLAPIMMSPPLVGGHLVLAGYCYYKYNIPPRLVLTPYFFMLGCSAIFTGGRILLHGLGIRPLA